MLSKIYCGFLLLCPWICFAGEPTPPTRPSTQSVFNITNANALKEMTRHLELNPKIENMKITCNNFTGGLRELLRLYGAVSRLQHRLKTLEQLTGIDVHIGLYDEWVCADGIINHLISILQKIPNLKRLSLNGAFQREKKYDSLGSLSKYVRGNDQLESINIEFAIHDDKQINKLAAAIEKHPSLRLIKLDQVYFGETSAENFVNALGSCGREVEIFVRNQTAFLLTQYYFSLLPNDRSNMITLNGKKLR